MKIALTIVGMFAVLLGLLWIGQGTGVIRFIPSPMIDQSIWSMWGVLLATVGVGCLVFSRRR